MDKNRHVQRGARGLVSVASVAGQNTIDSRRGVNLSTVENHRQRGFPLRQVGVQARSACVAQVVDELREREGVIAKLLEKGDTFPIRPRDASREAGGELPEPARLQARHPERLLERRSPASLEHRVEKLTRA